MVGIQLPSISEVVSGEFARIWTSILHRETCKDKFPMQFDSFIALFFICTNIAHIESICSIWNTAAKFCNNLLQEIQLDYDLGGKFS